MKIYKLLFVIMFALGYNVNGESPKNKSTFKNMVYIPAGEFKIGSNSGNISNEKPEHKVYLDAYYIDKYEVTFEQYDKFCEVSGRKKTDDNGWGRGKKPVINVSWDDAIAYAKWAGKRLPTEAEWEKACRAGSNTLYCFGNNESGIGDYAWYYTNSDKKTHTVGSKKPNNLGIYDMHGNVWEWCADFYDENYYENSSNRNPKGANNGFYRVIRGGSWGSNSDSCRSSRRGGVNLSHSNRDCGFRCVAIDDQTENQTNSQTAKQQSSKVNSTVPKIAADKKIEEKRLEAQQRSEERKQREDERYPWRVKAKELHKQIYNQALWDSGRGTSTRVIDVIKANIGAPSNHYEGVYGFYHYYVWGTSMKGDASPEECQNAPFCVVLLRDVVCVNYSAPESEYYTYGEKINVHKK